MRNDGSEITLGDMATTPARLSTTALPAERIGSTEYQARCAIVRSQHVTYQQKTHVFGYIASTVGGTWNGYGSVYGGGGSVSSKSESVVQMVYCDFDGCENTAELPASVSAREGSIMRLDFLNGALFAAQNLTGRQDVRGLLGPADFIAWPQWSGAQTVLTIVAIVCLLGHVWLGVLVFGAYPAYTLYRRQMVKKERKELGEYMGRALSATPA